MMSSHRLQRFKDAQDQPRSGFESALSEIRAGGKRTHWIWYVFPQLAGLGRSSTSQEYGLEGVAEAVEYLRDPLLRSRLLTITEAAAGQIGRGMTVTGLMGSSIDAAKLVSSLTLFREVAERLAETEDVAEYKSIARAADSILAAAAAQGFPLCRFTLDHLRNSSS